MAPGVAFAARDTLDVDDYDDVLWVEEEEDITLPSLNSSVTITTLVDEEELELEPITPALRRGRITVLALSIGIIPHFTEIVISLK